MTGIQRLVLCTALLTPLLCFAQPRSAMIDDIVAAQRSVDFPMFRERALPKFARARARTLLEDAGRQASLGADWRPGNPYWDRAEEAIVKDRLRALDRRSTRDRQDEANYREALGELSDAELAQVRSFYKSALFEKVVRQADAALASLAMLIAAGSDASSTEEQLQQIERVLASLKLSPEEEKEYDAVLKSPAFQTLNRDARQRLFSIASDPAATLSVPLADATVQIARSAIAAFRQANAIPSPPPPSYSADFISSPAVEKSLRETADAALRGDSEALARLQRLAEDGTSFAQAELGRVYSIGGRGIPQDAKLALEWTRKAAAQNLPRALFNLGAFYEQGQGIAQDFAAAADNYRRSAARNFARAQLALGLLHRYGKGVAQDFQESLRLIRAAAEQDLPPAQVALAEIYDAGAGVPQDARTADEWLARASRQGYALVEQYRAERTRRKADFQELLARSNPSAKASATAVDRPELDRRLLEAVKQVNIGYVRQLLQAGADIETRDAKPYQGETPLHQAARTGNVELARVLVEKGANVNVKAPSGFTPLHVAAGLNRQAMVAFLLTAGADPNAKDSRGTPLHAAVVQGNAAIVGLLLKHGADPNATDQGGTTPLAMIDYAGVYYPTHTQIAGQLARAGADLFALSRSNTTAFQLATRRSEEAALAILESGAKLVPGKPGATPLAVTLAWFGYGKALARLAEKGVALDAADKQGVTALHAAAGSGKTEIADFLLSKGLPIDVRAADGMTPLYRAADYGQVDMVRYLLDRGAAIEAKTSRGWTPLVVSLFSWREGKVAPLLRQRGADFSVRDTEGRSVLEVAMLSYSQDAVRFVLESGFPVQARDEHGRTALHKARSVEQVRLLLARGAQVNAMDELGMTPLFTAAATSGTDVVSALLAAGARTDVVAKDGTRPVHHAAATNSETLKLLLDRGAGTAQDVAADGETPLHWAAARGHRWTIELLVARGAALDARDAKGESPLHLAARSKRPENVEALLKAGSSTTLRDAAGDTPLDIAHHEANPNIVKLFEGQRQ